MIETELDGT